MHKSKLIKYLKPGMASLLLLTLSSCGWIDRMRIKEVVITNECGWYKVVTDVEDNKTVDNNNLMYEMLCLEPTKQQ